MQFSDLALSPRLERAEGNACVQFAEARRRLFPDSGAEWMEHAGVWAAFDGIGSPVTQTFGPGLFEELTNASLDVIERFFLDRGADVYHEVSPLAGVAAFSLLCSRQYRPVEISSVMYRPTEKTAVEDHGPIRVRVIGPEEAQLWTGIRAKGWAHEHPEFGDFIQQLAAVSSARDQRRISWPISKDSWARLVCSVCTTELRCSGEPLRSRNCAVAGFRPRCFTSECDTPSTTAAIWL